MNDLITHFIELATNHGDYLLNGDERANSYHKKLTKTIDQIKGSETSVKLAFKELLAHPNLSVKSWVAVELLGTYEQQSLETLNSVGKDKSILALNANSLIDMWNKGMIKKENWNF